MIRLPLLAVTTILAIFATTTADADDLIRTIAVTGFEAPGTSDGATFVSFDSATINELGQVALNAFLGDPPVPMTDQGVWSEGGGGGLQLVARSGMQAIDMPEGIQYLNFRDPHINNLGQIAFGTNHFDPASGFGIGPAIYSDEGDGVRMLTRTGDSAPGLSGYEIINYTVPQFLDDSGRTMFVGFVRDGGGNVGIDEFGIWVGVRDDLQFVAKNDHSNSIPGFGPSLREISPFPALNDAGNLLMRGTVGGSGTVESNNEVFVLFKPHEGLSLSLREGDPAADSDPGVTYGQPSVPHLGPADHITFTTRLIDAGGELLNQSALYSGLPGDYDKIAQKGDVAPGTTGDTVFDIISGGHADLDGDVVFAASLTGPSANSTNDLGFWAHRDGLLELIVRRGDEAPGTDEGVVFAGLSRWLSNTEGQSVFAWELTGPGVTDANDVGIWIEHGNGELQLAIREGDTIDVVEGPGVDLRTIKTLELLRGNAYRFTGFNSRGEALAQAEFLDGSVGILVVAIPEPSTWFLACLAAVTLVLVGWRRLRRDAHNCQARRA